MSAAASIKGARKEGSASDRKAATMEQYAALDFERSISEKQVDFMEECATSDVRGVARRIGLTLLARSKAELLKFRKGDLRDGSRYYLRMAKMLSDYGSHLAAVKEAMSSAEHRALAMAAHFEVQRALNRTARARRGAKS